MGNVQMPPNQFPIQNPNPPVPQFSSDVPGLPPGTFEYVDTSKKRNWKRILEVCAVVIVVTIPLVLTLFKKDYSFERTYAVLNPASFVTSPSYSPWSSFVTTAKQIIQPEITTTNQEKSESNLPVEETSPTSTPTTLPEPTVEPTLASQEVIYPTLNEEQIETIIQAEEEPTASPTKPYIFYPTSPPYNEQNEGDDNEPTASPTAKPTATPTPQSSPYTACDGKHKGDKCAYTSYGKKIEGKCKTSYGNSLICVKN